VNEQLLRDLVPAVIGVLVRREADFASAEDAVQDALVEAVRVWSDDPPQDPKGWLVTVTWRKFLDAARADTSRRRREVRIEGEPMPGPVEVADETLQLYFLCAHPSLTPASSVALTLRAVGGLTTRQALHCRPVRPVRLVPWSDRYFRARTIPSVHPVRAVSSSEVKFHVKTEEGITEIN
jgi:predicted RNA polymerase sigma factor